MITETVIIGAYVTASTLIIAYLCYRYALHKLDHRTKRKRIEHDETILAADGGDDDSDDHDGSGL